MKVVGFASFMAWRCHPWRDGVGRACAGVRTCARQRRASFTPFCAMAAIHGVTTTRHRFLRPAHRCAGVRGGCAAVPRVSFTSFCAMAAIHGVTMTGHRFLRPALARLRILLRRQGQGMHPCMPADGSAVGPCAGVRGGCAAVPRVSFTSFCATAAIHGVTTMRRRFPRPAHPCAGVRTRARQWRASFTPFCAMAAIHGVTTTRHRFLRPAHPCACVRGGCAAVPRKLAAPHPFTHTTWRRVCTTSTRSLCAAITASMSL